MSDDLVLQRLNVVDARLAALDERLAQLAAPAALALAAAEPEPETYRDGWVTIHGHPVYLGSGGGGAGGGGGPAPRPMTPVEQAGYTKAYNAYNTANARSLTLAAQGAPAAQLAAAHQRTLDTAAALHALQLQHTANGAALPRLTDALQQRLDQHLAQHQVLAPQHPAHQGAAAPAPPPAPPPPAPKPAAPAPKAAPSVPAPPSPRAGLASRVPQGLPQTPLRTWAAVTNRTEARKANYYETKVADRIEQGSAAWAAHLPPAQRAAIEDYRGLNPHTKKVYDVINGGLRGVAINLKDRATGQYIQAVPRLNAEFQGRIKALDAAVAANPLAKDVTVYRGLHPRPGINTQGANLYHQIPVGAVLDDDAFLSTCVQREYAASAFGAAPTGQRGVVLEIHVPQGTPAIVCDAVSHVPQGSERARREVLFGRGSRLRVVGKYRAPDQNGTMIDTLVCEMEPAQPKALGFAEPPTLDVAAIDLDDDRPGEPHLAGYLDDVTITDAAGQVLKPAGQPLPASFAEGDPEDYSHGGGNLGALLHYWHGRFGGGGGEPGDYNACVATLTGKHGISDAHSLCAWLHHQATGAWPGHAANEQHAEAPGDRFRDGWVEIHGHPVHIGAGGGGGGGGGGAAAAAPATHEALAAAGEHWRQSLTPDERQALAAYSATAYRPLNAALRGKTLGGVAGLPARPARLTDAHRAVAEQLDQALARARIDRPVTVYRGIHAGTSAAALAALPPGATIHDAGYASTSLDRERAGRFLHGSRGGVLLAIDAPAGAQAAYLAPLANLPQEREVLLPRGHTLTVVGHEQGTDPRTGLPVQIVHARLEATPTPPPLPLAEPAPRPAATADDDRFAVDLADLTITPPRRESAATEEDAR